MATINYAKRELECKIVYYGPGLCGKTTNLQTIHRMLPADKRGELSSVATQQDRTLFFDLLPLEIGKVKGFSLRMQLFTVPGQVYYNQSRKLVLQGADGIVFVADSQHGKIAENKESLENLMANLRELKMNPDTIPLVFQFNKRDIPGVIPLDILNIELNSKGLPFVEAVALTGQGVFDTLKAITTCVIEDFKRTIFAEVDAAAASAPAPEVPPTPSTTIGKPKSAPAAKPEEKAAAPAKKPGMFAWLGRLFGKGK